jgi:DNA-binding MarR family transcriptional regulator
MPRDRSTPDDFVGCVAGNLRAAARCVTRVYDDALRDTGLRITQIAVLAQIKRLQPLTVTELAAGLSSERSAVARDVAILQRAGLVSAVVKADDQRARDIRLTTEGRRRLAASAPAWHAAQEAMRKALGAARVDELVTLANELVETLDGS